MTLLKLNKKPCHPERSDSVAKELVKEQSELKTKRWQNEEAC